MSALGQQQTKRHQAAPSALPPKADIASFASICPLCAKSGLTHRSQIGRSFGHLVGAEQCRRRHVEAERLGDLEIENKLKFCCPLDWKIGGIGALENLVHEEGRATIDRNGVYSVADHAAGPCDLF